MEETGVNRCLNCQNDVNGKFCSNCGQKVNLTKINFKEISAEFLAAIANYDAPFPRTVIQMFVNPGKLNREYLAGKRKTYYSAARYLVICLAITILTIELLDYDPVGLEFRMSEEQMAEMSKQDEVIAGRFFHEYVNFFIFIFPFAIGLMARLFFRREQYNLTEMVAFGFFVAGQFLLINTVFIPIITFYPSFFKITTYLILMYITFAFYSMFKPKKKILGLVRSFFASLLSFILYTGVAYLLSIFLVKVFNLS